MCARVLFSVRSVLVVWVWVIVVGLGGIARGFGLLSANARQLYLLGGYAST